MNILDGGFCKILLEVPRGQAGIFWFWILDPGSLRRSSPSNFALEGMRDSEMRFKVRPIYLIFISKRVNRCKEFDKSKSDLFIGS